MKLRKAQITYSLSGLLSLLLLLILLITSVGNNYFSFYHSGFLDYLLYFYCYIPAVITTSMYDFLT